MSSRSVPPMLRLADAGSVSGQVPAVNGGFVITWHDLDTILLRVPFP